MFLFGDISGALQKIKATILETLGPLYQTTNLTGDRLTQYGIDFGIHIGATILLFIIVAIFFWKPITKILEQRREVIDKEFLSSATITSKLVLWVLNIKKLNSLKNISSNTGFLNISGLRVPFISDRVVL